MSDGLAEARHYDGKGLEKWWRSEIERRLRYKAWLYGDRRKRARRLALDRELCRRSWVHWASNWAWIWAPKVEPAKCRDMPLVPWPSQVEAGDWVLERTRARETAGIPKSRELGISYLCCNLIAWLALFEPEFQAHMGSRVEALVDRKGDRNTLFAKVRQSLYRQPSHILDVQGGGIVTDSHMVIQLRRGATITGEATHENFGASGRNSVVFIDEFARVSQRIASGMWLSLETVAASIWPIWNPGPKDHITYELHHGETGKLPSRMLHPMDWRANPTRPDDFIESLIVPRGRLTRPFVESAHCLKYGYVATGLIFHVDWERTYYEDDEAPDWSKTKHVRVGGWDFGSGASLLVNIQGNLEYMRADPTLWIDWDEGWQGTTWRQAAVDSLAGTERYGQEGATRYDWGDPAGRAKESDQSSWEANLRAGGVPLECLPAAYNTREMLEFGYKETGTWFDDLRIRIHRRCRLTRESVESWRRDLPEGVEVGQISRAYIPPRKDQFSHAGQALTYLVMGAKRWLATTHAGTQRPPGDDGKAEPEQLSDMQHIHRLMDEARRMV